MAQLQGEEAARFVRDTMEAIRTEIARVVVGQDETVMGALIGLSAGGHILLEGAPGLGKTLLVRSLSQAVDLPFSRIQFTPDLMPADITGTNVLADGEGGRREFQFRPGPIFASILLADEINRATPKTQSALLEAMQEGAVTAGGTRHALPPPFLVMATQNPIEHEGTYVLPEAQLDRFLLKIVVPYPLMSELAGIVDRTTGSASQQCGHVANREAILEIQRIVRDVPIAPSVRDYALSFIVASHPGSDLAPGETNRYVRYGSSPRGAQALILSAKVLALVAGRFNVSHDDIRTAAVPALRHRILLNYEAEADGMTSDSIITAITTQVDKAEKEPVKL